MSQKIKVGIVGVGNCASSLIQGVEYYAKARSDEAVPGLMHVDLGPYHVSDIEFSCAFDVDANKVGLDLGEAIWVEPNNTIKFSDVPELGIEVLRGHTYDGLGTYYRDTVTESEMPPVDVAKVLRDTGTDVLINYLPVGSEQAARFYAEQALEAGVAFINCMPVFIATNEDWAARFTKRGVPIIGDDIKSQVGATISHRVLSKLFEDRGVIIDHTYQLNFGGNMDFKNMLERDRLKSKKISKTQSVTSQITHGIDPEDIHIGPSDHVPWLKDRKWAYIRIEGREFGDVPISMELKLEVWDSPNSAGVVIDAVRCAKVALDRGIGGPLLAPSAYFMKSPPVQYTDAEAHDLVEAFIEGTVGGDARPVDNGNGHRSDVSRTSAFSTEA
ncbi:MAG TPA: inositol-3-phosphate synthase [Actinomycetota bacterium]|jgi:myo-inositol-1-phosphate synthase|nr:inositol-3-phosphate synthase [Actinomycetota bacterium]